MNQSEENALLSRAKAGSKPAFTSLMAEHESGLYRFLLVRSRTRDDAEDAMQEAFISAYRYIHSYDSRWRFSTWLYRIALRELAKLPQSDCGDPAEEQTDYNALDPLQACIEAEDSENLWLLARKKLGGESFVALWLRYAEDMSIKEVAHAMGRSATWVKVALHRARNRLKDHREKLQVGNQPKKCRDNEQLNVKANYETLT